MIWKYILGNDDNGKYNSLLYLMWKQYFYTPGQ